MDYRSLHMKTVADLRRIAKEEKIKIPTGTTKALLVGMILEKIKEKTEEKPAEAKRESISKPELPAGQRSLNTQQRMGARTLPVQGAYRSRLAKQPGKFNAVSVQNRPVTGFRRQYAEDNAASPPREEVGFEEKINSGVPELIADGDCGDGAGILEIHPDGYGFLRAENYLPGNKDVYVSAAQIRRFNLRTGDYVVGKTRPNQLCDRSVGLIFINEINGQSPDMARRRRFFRYLR